MLDWWLFYHWFILRIFHLHPLKQHSQKKKKKQLKNSIVIVAPFVMPVLGLIHIPDCHSTKAGPSFTPVSSFKRWPLSSICLSGWEFTSDLWGPAHLVTPNPLVDCSTGQQEWWGGAPERFSGLTYWESNQQKDWFLWMYLFFINNSGCGPTCWKQTNNVDFRSQMLIHVTPADSSRLQP